MADSAALAGAVVGVAEFVGLVGVASWGSTSGGEPRTRAMASDAFFLRDEHRGGNGGEGSPSTVHRRTRHVGRFDPQPAAGVASGAIPARDGAGFRFWINAD